MNKMENYFNAIREVINNTTITEEEIFNFQYSPLKDEFNSIFEFYSETLRQNSHYGIEPSYIFFNNKFSVNAFAGKSNNIYLIGVNMGTIVSLINMFRNQNNILSETNIVEFIEFEKNLDTSINEIMYQNAIHFTFYHELAHLIQKSNYLENKLYEHLENNLDYTLERHILELDADEFSSICIAAHISQYATHIFGNNLTSDQLEKLLIIVCSSALLYMMSFNTNKQKLYYEEMTHPHPIIRISCVVFVIAGHCLNTLKQQGVSLIIDIKKVVEKTIKFSSDISDKIFPANPVEDYQ